MPVARRLAAGVLLFALALLFETCKLDDLISPPRTGTLSVEPTLLLDSAPVGSVALRVTRFSVASAAVEAFPWVARTAHDGTWVALGTTRGTTPETLSVMLKPSGLPRGVYQDTIIIAPDGPAGSAVLVPVEFRITGCQIAAIAPFTQVSDSLGASDCAAPHRSGRFARLYSFDASAGDSISVRLSSTDFDGYLVLDSSTTSGAPPLAESDACRAGQADPCLSYVSLPRSGTYVVEATTASPGEAGSFTLSVTRPRPPLTPDSLVQLAGDSTTVVPAGGTIDQPALVLRAVVSDLDVDDSLRLEVEVQPVGVAFAGTPTAASSQAARNARAMVRAADLPNDAYHWQVRTIDETGRTSSWVSFGANPESSPDFRVAVPQPPDAPTSLVQLRSDGQTVIAVGGATDERTALFRALVSDPDLGDQLRFEVEVQPLGTPFTNSPTGSSAPVASGGPATATISGFSDNVSYHWQARAVDQGGRAGAWLAFGANPETAEDFRVALAPTRLAVTEQPTTTSAGAAIAPAMRVAAQDALGNTVTSFTGTVSVALGTNLAGGTLSGTRAVAAVAGVATFADLSIDRTGVGYTLLVSTATLSTMTNAFSITPGAPARLAYLVQPSNATAGAALTPVVQVTALDAPGNAATSFTGSVTLALGANPGGGALSGTTTVSAVGGIAIFPVISINRSGTGYTLTASAANLAVATSEPFAISPGTAAKLSLTTQPSASAQSGSAFGQQPAVQVQDANGNAVSQLGVLVAATIASGPGGATVSSGSATTDSNGLATFSGLGITGPVGSYALSFTAPGLSAATSATIGLAAGAPAKLAIATQPSGTAQNGTPLTQQPVIQIQDAVGNGVSQNGIQVTAAIASGGGTLGGTTTVATNASGSAAFTDLSITGTVGTRTLSFTASGLAGATSTAVTVGPGVASQIALNAGDNQTATVGTAVPVPPSVVVRDASGNAVSGVPVTFTVMAGGGTVAPASAVTTDANGVAAITSWTLGSGTGTNTLQASVTGLAGSPVTFTATATVGAAASITRSAGDNLTGQVGTVLEAAHEVLITDASGNPVPNVSVAWSAATGGGSVSPALGPTDSSGHARTTRTLGVVPGTQTTTATATLGGVPTSVTFTITATVGTATQMVASGGDSQVDTAGATLSSPLSVLVTD
ncbi:MAG: Ig-like domain-containing protein, partial [Gemmatimonadetes bacterium]|nr:Ig-like domain-containing protein [Gemmatimonadota bacterium]